jgi:hypothetical protein
MGMQLFGVATVRGAGDSPASDGTSVVVVRELGAVVRPANYTMPALDDREVLEWNRIVYEVFQNRTILPAPCGTVFRSEEHLHKWLDLNYVALVEGIHFVDGRCEVRVHVIDASPDETDEEVDPQAAASDAFRHLRKHAVASLPLRPEEGRMLSGAFLMDRGDVSEFERHVREEERRANHLRFEMTGPWPPYDFVRMDFGV